MTVNDEDFTKLYIVHSPDGTTVVFDPEDKRYKCCCNSMHVRTASILVGVLECLGVLTALIVLTINYYKLGQNYSTQFAVGVTFVVLYTVVLNLFFCSLCAQNATFVVAHLLLQLVTMVLFVSVIALIAVQLAQNDTVQLRYWAGRGAELEIDVGLSYLTVAITLIVVCALSFIMYVWFFVIVWRCYKYFADRKKFRNYIAATQVVRVPFKTMPQNLNINTPTP